VCTCSALAQNAMLAVLPAQAAAPKGIPVPDMPVLTTTKLEGGLIVEDMKVGQGYEIKPGDAVVAHYHGTLRVDPNTVFDSSFSRGEPLGFPLAAVIPGWQKGVPGMKIGGVRRLIVPAAMAYGEGSPSPAIPPNSDLVFVIALVDVLGVEDLKVGAGDMTATSRCVAITAYTITDKDGKVIEKHDASDPYIWIPNEYAPISLGIQGMKLGGKRRIKVPAAFNQFNADFARESGPARPANVLVTIEVELLKMRNIPIGSKTPGC